MTRLGVLDRADGFAGRATTALMTRLIKAEKLFYCPIKRNRQVDESGGEEPYRSVETLAWTAAEEQTGKVVKLKGFAGRTRLKLFRVAVSTHRTEYIVTNEMTQSDEVAQKESGRRWKIEQFAPRGKTNDGFGTMSVPIEPFESAITLRRRCWCG